MVRMRYLSVLAIAGLVLAAGCTTVGDSSTTQPAPTSTTESEIGERQPTAPAAETPVPSETPAESTAPATDSENEIASMRALRAEGAFLEARLRNASCLEQWGTGGGVVSKESTVINDTAAGQYVEITHPYWYSTDADEADSASRATYLVSSNGTQRVAGDPVRPC